MTGLLPSRLLPSHLLGTGGVTGRRPGALDITLGHPGRCPAEPTLAVCIFDDSGSMLGGSDSTGLRYAEAGLALDRVARRCRCGQELAAVLHMNRPTSADLPVTPLNRRTGAAVTAALTVPGDGDGASEMAATLRRAVQLAHSHSRHRSMLAAFSDYELVDDMRTLAAELQGFPGDVHAVVMRSAPPQPLLDADGITVTHVPAGAAPGAVAHALFDTLTTHRPGARPTAARRPA